MNGLLLKPILYIIISGEDGRHAVPGHDTHAVPETDSVTQTLAALENRLNIELKV